MSESRTRRTCRTLQNGKSSAKASSVLYVHVRPSCAFFLFALLWRIQKMKL